MEYEQSPGRRSNCCFDLSIEYDGTIHVLTILLFFFSSLFHSVFYEFYVILFTLYQGLKLKVKIHVNE